MVVFALGILGTRVFRLDLESMGAKVVSLCLQKVGRQILGAITVIEAEGGAKSWRRDSPDRAFAYDISPTWLCLVDGLVEEVIKEKILQVRVLAVG